MDELLARGLKSVPVTIWNDDVVIGFNPKELARLLDLNSEIAVVDLPTMLEKYETILTGAARAIRQIPEEKGEWESPERQRTIRQFTFHLCDRPDRALNAHDVGRYATEDRGREVEQVLGLSWPPRCPHFSALPFRLRSVHRRRGSRPIPS